MSNTSFLTAFFKMESSGGILLILAGILAMICANTPVDEFYRLLLSSPVEIRIGKFEIAKPLLLWINDGLMAVFFFMIGLELKREALEGELSNRANIILPGVGAVGGMLLPACIYAAFNYQDPIAIRGWAIPAATDIAFALGVLSLLGPKVPVSLKVFLTSLAIFDDVGAIIIIAIFYTSKISLASLVVVAVTLCLLFIMNRRNVDSKSSYILVGLVMWAAMLKSGVHATLAGVLLAMFIPMRARDPQEPSPLKGLEKDLHSAVAFGILPIFAFANAGVNFEGMTLDHLLHGVPLGIAAGLFLGNQIGIFSLCWLAIQLKWTKMPEGMTWGSLYGTSMLCGIGFTMSLFIGSLAFEGVDDVQMVFDERVGILLGSLISGILGFLILKATLKSSG